jgi:large subunit ribosomal protein L29
MNTNKEIRQLSNLSIEKLYDRLTSLKRELFNLRFQRTLGELKNTSQFVLIKKNIARINTELSKRRLVSGE